MINVLVYSPYGGSYVDNLLLRAYTKPEHWKDITRIVSLDFDKALGKIRKGGISTNINGIITFEKNIMDEPEDEQEQSLKFLHTTIIEFPGIPKFYCCPILYTNLVVNLRKKGVYISPRDSEDFFREVRKHSEDVYRSERSKV